MTRELLLASGLLLAACDLQDQGRLYSFDSSFRGVSIGATFCRDFDESDRLVWKNVMTSSELAITDLLLKYVNQQKRVNYQAWRANHTDAQALKVLLADLSNQRSNVQSRDEQLALYVNFYNLATLDLIVSNYEGTLGGANSPLPQRRSIRNIENLDFTVWDVKKFQFGNESLSLNQIEKNLIIPLKDARIHFAINCASGGCPPLSHYAFTASKINEQFDDLACGFVNSGEATIFDNLFPGEFVIFTSQIMDWYKTDFESHSGETFTDVRSFFAYYLDSEKYNIEPSELFATDSASGTFLWQIDFNSYDWTLNEVSL